MKNNTFVPSVLLAIVKVERWLCNFDYCKYCAVMKTLKKLALQVCFDLPTRMQYNVLVLPSNLIMY